MSVLGATGGFLLVFGLLNLFDHAERGTGVQPLVMLVHLGSVFVGVALLVFSL